MQLSIHYYVLSLSERKSRLYEGFREKLIDIQDTKFPFEYAVDSSSPAKLVTRGAQLRDFFIQTDQYFGHYFGQDPLRLVVAGEKANLDVYYELTNHRDAMIGTIEGDYTLTSIHDLGKIVWPVVRDAIAGAHKNAMRDLAAAAKANKVISGIVAVGQCANKNTGATLYVEDDYHEKGSINKTDHSLIFSKYANLWEVLDDIVDIIIENVLLTGGNVVFLKSGSLIKLKRIALILHG